MQRRVSALMFAVAFSSSIAPSLSLAEPVTGDSGGDMLVDAVLLRPLGLATTVLGSAVFVLGLPFTLPSGTVGESACQLVKRPAAYTFARPLGDLAECSGAGCDVCSKPASAGRADPVQPKGD